METERRLVENNVLYNQNNVILGLLKASEVEYIDDYTYEAIYNNEIMEWWLVTPSFARLLKAEGEYILEILDCYWWGRTCSGQAIYLDSVIVDIARKI